MDRRNKNRAEREVHEASLSSNAELCAAEVSEQDEPSSEPDASESRKVAASLTSACMDGPFAATAETRVSKGSRRPDTQAASTSRVRRHLTSRESTPRNTGTSETPNEQKTQAVCG